MFVIILTLQGNVFMVTIMYAAENCVLNFFPLKIFPLKNSDCYS